jgi:anaerobic selenocysteine-containing dehydrogenase
MIYDEGSMVARSALLHGLARKPFAEMNGEDMKELGIADGDDVVVTANDFEVRVPARLADIARRVVFLPYDQPGLKASRLITGDHPTVEVRPS